MHSILAEIASTYNLKRKSGKYVGPCPQCGGSANSDKFNIKDDGGFKCYSCNFKGDLITWFRKIENMSCPEAHVAANQECRFADCQVKGTCRMGDGSGKKQGKIARSVTSITPNSKRTLAKVSPKSPKEIWLEWATDLLAKSNEKIEEHPAIGKYLAERGIDQAAIKRFKLGFLDHDRRVERKEIGLSEKKDGKTRLWVPGGMVIPIFNRDGILHRLRIRRTKEARAKFLPKGKYFWIEGSGSEPMAIPPTRHSRGAVIVEAELDAMAVAAAHEDVFAIAVGTVQGGVHPDLGEQLNALPVILVALDADKGKENKIGEGPAAFAAWKETYRQARYYPVLTGKDPGDYVKAGGDLRRWVELGLVPQLKPVVSSSDGHDFAFSPGQALEGGGGKQPKIVKEAEPKYEIIKNLRWCPLCYGDLFLAGENGGYFCPECQPLNIPGKLVRAGKSRGTYIVN